MNVITITIEEDGDLDLICLLKTERTPSDEPVKTIIDRSVTDWVNYDFIKYPDGFFELLDAIILHKKSIIGIQKFEILADYADVDEDGENMDTPVEYNLYVEVLTLE